MIGAWLGAKALFGLSRGLWLLLAVAALAGLAWWFSAAEKADDKANQEIGATVQRDKDKTTAIERTVKGNEVRNEVEREGQRGAGNRLYAECLRGNRGATEVCQRYLLPE